MGSLEEARKALEKIKESLSTGRRLFVVRSKAEIPKDYTYKPGDPPWIILDERSP